MLADTTKRVKQASATQGPVCVCVCVCVKVSECERDVGGARASSQRTRATVSGALRSMKKVAGLVASAAAGVSATTATAVTAPHTYAHTHTHTHYRHLRHCRCGKRGVGAEQSPEQPEACAIQRQTPHRDSCST